MNIKFDKNSGKIEIVIGSITITDDICGHKNSNSSVYKELLDQFIEVTDGLSYRADFSNRGSFYRYLAERLEFSDLLTPEGVDPNKIKKISELTDDEIVYNLKSGHESTIYLRHSLIEEAMRRNMIKWRQA